MFNFYIEIHEPFGSLTKNCLGGEGGGGEGGK